MRLPKTLLFLIAMLGTSVLTLVASPAQPITVAAWLLTAIILLVELIIYVVDERERRRVSDKWRREREAMLAAVGRPH